MVEVAPFGVEAFDTHADLAWISIRSLVQVFVAGASRILATRYSLNSCVNETRRVPILRRCD